MAGKKAIILAIAIICFSQSGCAILRLPFQAVKLAFDGAGAAIKLLDKIPKLPVGAF